MFESPMDECSYCVCLGPLLVSHVLPVRCVSGQDFPLLFLSNRPRLEISTDLCVYSSTYDGNCTLCSAITEWKQKGDEKRERVEESAGYSLFGMVHPTSSWI